MILSPRTIKFILLILFVTSSTNTVLAQDYTLKNFSNYFSISQGANGINIYGNDIKDNLGNYFLKGNSTSTNFILNQTTQQSGANFNISGTGIASAMGIGITPAAKLHVDATTEQLRLSITNASGVSNGWSFTATNVAGVANGADLLIAPKQYGSLTIKPGSAAGNTNIYGLLNILGTSSGSLNIGTGQGQFTVVANTVSSTLSLGGWSGSSIAIPAMLYAGGTNGIVPGKGMAIAGSNGPSTGGSVYIYGGHSIVVDNQVGTGISAPGNVYLGYNGTSVIGNVIMPGLTASALVYTDANKNLVSGNSISNTFILNQNTQQSGANFNISGTGIASAIGIGITPAAKLHVDATTEQLRLSTTNSAGTSNGWSFTATSTAGTPYGADLLLGVTSGQPYGSLTIRPGTAAGNTNIYGLLNILGTSSGLLNIGTGQGQFTVQANTVSSTLSLGGWSGSSIDIPAMIYAGGTNGIVPGKGMAIAGSNGPSTGGSIYIYGGHSIVVDNQVGTGVSAPGNLYLGYNGTSVIGNVIMPGLTAAAPVYTDANKNLISGGVTGTPTITAGTGAGTSPTVSVASNGVALQVTVTIGTSPSGTNATIASITLPNALPYSPFPVFSPGNAAAAALSTASMVFMSSTGTANVTITSGATALSASTTYVWNISVQ